MSDSPKRLHLESLMGKDPETRKSFARICALLMATNAKDLECDMQFGNKQYHFDVSEVATLAQPSGTVATSNELVVNKELLICDRCGKTNEEDPTVCERACGYSKEINGTELWEIVCDDCEHEHLMEI